MTRATIEESSSAPAASGVPSLGMSSHAPEGMIRASACDSPEGGGGPLVEVAGPGHVEPRGEGIHQVEAFGQSGQPAVDGPHLELVGAQLDQQGHHPFVAGSVGVIGGLVPVVQGGLVAVVTVGDDHRGLLHRLLHRADGRGVVDHPELVADAVVVDSHRVGRGRAQEGGGEPRRSVTGPRWGRDRPGWPAGGRAGRFWPWAGSPRAGRSRLCCRRRCPGHRSPRWWSGRPGRSSGRRRRRGGGHGPGCRPPPTVRVGGRRCRSDRGWPGGPVRGRRC